MRIQKFEQLSAPGMLFHTFLLIVTCSNVNTDQKLLKENTVPISWKDTSPIYIFETEATFMASGRNLTIDGDLTEINSQLSIFFKTYKSDYNNQSTEVAPHNSNPDWMTVFRCRFDKNNEEEYHFKVKIFEANDKSLYIGEAKIGIHKIWQTLRRDGKITVKLTSGAGHLILKRAEILTFKLSATNLAKADTFGGKSDPYVKCFWSHGPGGQEVEFFRTSWVGNVVDAEWMEIISFEAYHKGSDQYLHFKLYDDDGFTSDDFLGEAYLKLDEQLKSDMNKPIVVSLINEPKKKTGKGSLIVNFLKAGDA